MRIWSSSPRWRIGHSSLPFAFVSSVHTRDKLKCKCKKNFSTCQILRGSQEFSDRRLFRMSTLAPIHCCHHDLKLRINFLLKRARFAVPYEMNICLLVNTATIARSFCNFFFSVTAVQSMKKIHLCSLKISTCNFPSNLFASCSFC